MSEVIDTDSLATRRLILEEFEKVQAEIVTNPELWRKLSFEAHKMICETMGANFVNYPGFRDSLEEISNWIMIEGMHIEYNQQEIRGYAAIFAGFS